MTAHLLRQFLPDCANFGFHALLRVRGRRGIEGLSDDRMSDREAGD